MQNAMPQSKQANQMHRQSNHQKTESIRLPHIRQFPRSNTRPPPTPTAATAISAPALSPRRGHGDTARRGDPANPRGLHLQPAVCPPPAGRLQLLLLGQPQLVHLGRAVAHALAVSVHAYAAPRSA